MNVGVAGGTAVTASGFPNQWSNAAVRRPSAGKLLPSFKTAEFNSMFCFVFPPATRCWANRKHGSDRPAGARSWLAASLCVWPLNFPPVAHQNRGPFTLPPPTWKRSGQNQEEQNRATNHSLFSFDTWALRSHRQWKFSFAFMRIYLVARPTLSCSKTYY